MIELLSRANAECSLILAKLHQLNAPKSYSSLVQFTKAIFKSLPVSEILRGSETDIKVFKVADLIPKTAALPIKLDLLLVCHSSSLQTANPENHQSRTYRTNIWNTHEQVYRHSSWNAQLLLHHPLLLGSNMRQASLFRSFCYWTHFALELYQFPLYLPIPKIEYKRAKNTRADFWLCWTYLHWIQK